MNLAHAHLLLNHVPVLGTIFACVLLAWGICAHSRDLTRAALVMIVFSALVSIPTFLTGEPAEDVIEHLPGVLKSRVGAHEEAAEFGFYLLLPVGALALAALVVPGFSESARKKITAAVLVGTLLVSVIMARTAYLGGMIRHTEIRAGAAVAPEHADD
jgi:uncharacterized membrane protein